MDNIPVTVLEDGTLEYSEIDDFTGDKRILASGRDLTEFRNNYQKYVGSLPKVSCDLENPHLCESCQ